MKWLIAGRGHFHPSLEIKHSEYTHNAANPQVDSLDDRCGLSVFAKHAVAADETLVTCPAELMVTPQLAVAAIREVTGVSLNIKSDTEDDQVGAWKEVSLMAMYLALHWVYHERSPE